MSKSGVVVSVFFHTREDVAKVRRAAAKLGIKYTILMREAALDRADRALAPTTKKKKAA